MAQALDHARINPNWPERAAQCQRCGDIYNLSDLSPQYYFAGFQLQNSNLYVCPTCLDIPAPFQRTIILPPDPPPTYLARVINFPQEEQDYIVLEGGTTNLVEENRITQVVPELSILPDTIISTLTDGDSLVECDGFQTTISGTIG